jgi:hypothetical protein
MGLYMNTSFTISHSILLKMRNVETKVVKKIKTNTLCSITFFTATVPFIRRCGKILQS